MANAYQIDLSGTIYAGNTAFLSPDTAFTPIENFLRSGVLLIESPIFPSNIENTDQNDFELAIFSGSIVDQFVEPGEIQFTSNTYLHTYMGGNFSQTAAIDVVEQDFDPITGTWSIAIGDPSTARASQLNTFNTGNNILSAPKPIIAGFIELQFSPDEQQISGSISLVGGGFIEPSTSLYSAEFSGILTQQYIGIAEQATEFG